MLFPDGLFAGNQASSQRKSRFMGTDGAVGQSARRSVFTKDFSDGVEVVQRHHALTAVVEADYVAVFFLPFQQGQFGFPSEGEDAPEEREAWNHN